MVLNSCDFMLKRTVYGNLKKRARDRQECSELADRDLPFDRTQNEKKKICCAGKCRFHASAHYIVQYSFLFLIVYIRNFNTNGQNKKVTI